MHPCCSKRRIKGLGKLVHGKCLRKSVCGEERQQLTATLICDTQPWKDLKAHVEDIKKTHLRDLMNDKERCESMMLEFDGMFLDYTRQCATLDTMDKLYKLAEAASLKQPNV